MHLHRHSQPSPESTPHVAARSPRATRLPAAQGHRPGRPPDPAPAGRHTLAAGRARDDAAARRQSFPDPGARLHTGGDGRPRIQPPAPAHRPPIVSLAHGNRPGDRAAPPRRASAGRRGTRPCARLHGAHHAAPPHARPHRYHGGKHRLGRGPVAGWRHLRHAGGDAQDRPHHPHRHALWRRLPPRFAAHVGPDPARDRHHFARPLDPLTQAAPPPLPQGTGGAGRLPV